MHPNETRVRAVLDIVHSGNVISKGLEDYFTPDAYYQPLVPAVDPIHGADAIVGEIARQLTVYKDLHAEIHVIMANDTHVFTERTDHVTFADLGTRVSVPLMAVFDFAPDGLITAWREIFDTRAAEAQIGVSQDDMAKIMGQ